MILGAADLFLWVDVRRGSWVVKNYKRVPVCFELQLLSYCQFICSNGSCDRVSTMEFIKQKINVLIEFYPSVPVHCCDFVHVLIPKLFQVNAQELNACHQITFGKWCTRHPYTKVWVPRLCIWIGVNESNLRRSTADYCDGYFVCAYLCFGSLCTYLVCWSAWQWCLTNLTSVPWASCVHYLHHLFAVKLEDENVHQPRQSKNSARAHIFVKEYSDGDPDEQYGTCVDSESWFVCIFRSFLGFCISQLFPRFWMFHAFNRHARLEFAELSKVVLYGGCDLRPHNLASYVTYIGRFNLNISKAEVVAVCLN